MHDPLFVAFEIRRPWPARSHTGSAAPKRWGWEHYGAWWKPGSWSPFMDAFGSRWYFPAVVTIWHHEPGGRDMREVCKNTRRARWHVHHWRIQIRPLQDFRRWALTRCAWCGGRSRRGDRINVSHSWDPARTHWWQSERGLYHGDCSTIENAHRTCTCPDPLLSHDGYGRCALCGRFRAWGSKPDRLAKAERLRELVPAGCRDTTGAIASVYPPSAPEEDR